MKRIASVVVLVACSKGSGGFEAPKLVAQELDGNGVHVKGALPDGWARNDQASMGGVRLELRRPDGTFTAAISVARAMSRKPAKDIAADRASLDATYGAGHVINAGVEVAPGRFGNALNLLGPGTEEGIKRVEAKVYWDTAQGVVQCTVAMDAPNADAAYALCTDLEVTLR